MKDRHPNRRDRRLDLCPLLTLSGGARCVVISVPGMSHPMFVPSARQARTASNGFSDWQANQAVSSVYNVTKEKIQGRGLFNEEYSLPCERWRFSFLYLLRCRTSLDTGLESHPAGRQRWIHVLAAIIPALESLNLHLVYAAVKCLTPSRICDAAVAFGNYKI